MSNALFESAHPTLTVRIHAGLNAASFLAGLLAVTGVTRFVPAQQLLENCFPGVEAKLAFVPRSVGGISGVTCRFETPAPKGHVHTTPAQILAFYETSRLSETGLLLARSIWTTLAQAEARVHGACPDEVHFHEVGRLSNILAVGLIAELFAGLAPERFVVSPIPAGDTVVRCAHGLVPYPAPSTLAMLDGVTVRGYAGSGEPVTPTGLAIVRGLEAEFGSWPVMQVQKHATAFVPNGVFENTPNGLIFALGRS